MPMVLIRDFTESSKETFLGDLSTPNQQQFMMNLLAIYVLQQGQECIDSF